MPLSNGGGGNATIMVALAFAFGALQIVEGAGVLLLTKHSTEAAVAKEDAASQARARARQHETIAVCTRGNRGRAYLRLRAREVDSRTAGMATTVFPILDCVQTTLSKPNRDVPLPPAEQRRYLQLFDQGREGIVEGSQVVRSRPL